MHQEGTDIPDKILLFKINKNNSRFDPYGTLLVSNTLFIICLFHDLYRHLYDI